MGKFKLPDVPELPEIPTVDEDDLGRRLSTVCERIGERAGKRAGTVIGGVVSFGVGTINDLLELPRELTKKEDMRHDQ